MDVQEAWAVLAPEFPTEGLRELARRIWAGGEGLMVGNWYWSDGEPTVARVCPMLCGMVGHIPDLSVETAENAVRFFRAKRGEELTRITLRIDRIGLAAAGEALLPLIEAEIERRVNL